MKNVLFYGDSNTWGYQGDDPMHRLDADQRYTGVVAAQFPDVHFIEEGLCGRTICSTDRLITAETAWQCCLPCWQRTIRST